MGLEKLKLLLLLSLSMLIVGCDTRVIGVLPINGKYYPSFQFIEAQPDACGEMHWHAHETVYSIYGESDTDNINTVDQVGLTDPNPRGCGFGTLSELKPIGLNVANKQFKLFYSWHGPK